MPISLNESLEYISFVHTKRFFTIRHSIQYIKRSNAFHQANSILNQSPEVCHIITITKHMGDSFIIIMTKGTHFIINNANLLVYML